MKILNKQDYPIQLQQIPDVPEKMYLEGNMPSQDTKLLCVVGSRKNTGYGNDVCRKLIKGLKNKNVSIISGLALGIDTIAHETALEIGLHTLALPGSGLDKKVLHPRSNVPLAQRIINAGGGLLSEYEPEEPAGVWTFPRRNRIMAGLSHYLLVVEAGIKSGTLITARLATDYNRDVFAVPGSIFSSTSAGANMLLRIGATPITKEDDLLEALGFEVQLTIPDAQNDCNQQELKILELLNEPLTRDELSWRSGLSASDTAMYISMLEMKGYIVERLGEICKVCY